MVNLYRFCIAILFASLSISFAQMCSVDSCIQSTGLTCYQQNDDIFSQKTKGDVDHSATLAQCSARTPSWDFGSFHINGNTARCVRGNGSLTSISVPVVYYSETTTSLFCSIGIDPKPDLSGWENCKSGKDHGFSWIIIGDASGEGESRFKREFWSCDDPDFWETYDHPPEKVPTDPDKPGEGGDKPTDPTDPDKPGEGGDGDRPGEGGDNPGGENGSDNGGCIGNNCGSSGEGLSKGDITDAINDADILGCKGDGCSAVDLKGQGTDSDFAAIPNSFWESKYESHDLMKLYEEKIESKSDSIVGQLSMINTDIGEGTCPVIELPDGFEDFQIDCNFLLLIRAAFIFSATLSAFFIIFRRS